MLWYLNKIKKRVDIDNTLKTSFIWVYSKEMLLEVLTSWLIYINQSDELNDITLLKIGEIYFQMIDR